MKSSEPRSGLCERDIYARHADIPAWRSRASSRRRAITRRCTFAGRSISDPRKLFSLGAGGSTQEDLDLEQLYRVFYRRLSTMVHLAAALRLLSLGRTPMDFKEPLVSVVDDDDSVREALPDLVRLFGFEVRAFSSATEFLESEWLRKTECLILDVAMPGMSGPELQEELGRRGITTPIVFITAHKDEQERLSLIRSGAAACLFKPFSAIALSQTLDQIFSRRSSLETS